MTPNRTYIAMNLFLAMTAAAFILSAVSCSDYIPGTMTLETSGTYRLSDDSEAELDLKINIEYLVSGPAKDVMDSINGSIASAMFGDVPSDVSVEEALIEYKDRKVAEYREVNLPLLVRDSTIDRHPASASWSDYTTGAVSGFYDDILSYTVTKDTYTGGAHGTTSVKALNLDMKTGAAVTEEEMFKAGYADRLSGLLTGRLPESLENPADTSMLFEKDIRPNGNFTVSDSGVTYIYNQYEIGPYVMGTIKVTVPWNELKDLLRH